MSLEIEPVHEIIEIFQSVRKNSDLLSLPHVMEVNMTLKCIRGISGNNLATLKPMHVDYFHQSEENKFLGVI